MDTLSDRSDRCSWHVKIGQVDEMETKDVVRFAIAEMSIRELCWCSSKHFVYRERLWKSVDEQDLPVPTICHDRRQGIVR